jgi:hypothetical protein
MQSTLGIDAEICRAAKAQAASQGTPVTRFSEQARSERLSDFPSCLP